MPIQPVSNARAVLRRNGKIIAYAQGGGRVLCRFDNKNLTMLKLRNLALAKDGLGLPGNDFEETLGSEQFEIEIRNSDGSVTLFPQCKADVASSCGTPKTATLASVDFYTLDAP